LSKLTTLSKEDIEQEWGHLQNIPVRKIPWTANEDESIKEMMNEY